MFRLALLSVLLGTSMHEASGDGWYRFPARLEGRWQITSAVKHGQEIPSYARQIVQINDSSIVMSTSSSTREYHLTFVDTSSQLIAVVLTGKLPEYAKARTAGPRFPALIREEEACGEEYSLWAGVEELVCVSR